MSKNTVIVTIAALLVALAALALAKGRSGWHEKEELIEEQETG